MTIHLSDEQLNLLHTHKMRGSAFVEALHHVQDCDYCRNRMPKRKAQEILNSIFNEESAPIYAKQQPALIPSFWRLLTPLTVCALLLLLGSATFLVIRNGQKQENIAQIDNPESAETPIISQNTETTEKSAELNQTQPIAGENSKNNKTQKVKIEKEKLHRLLTKTPQTVSSLHATNNLEKLPKQILNAVVQNSKVRLVWTKIKDAVHYEIAIFDKTYQEIARQTVSTNSFQLEESVKKGHKYFWKLIAYNAYGEPILEEKISNIGTFQVKNKQVQELGKSEKNNADNLAILDFMIEKGMLQEAKSKLQILSSQNPKNAQIKKLTKKVDNLIK